MIGAGDSFDVVERRAGYQEAVLPIAREITPNRLQPIARRLAEQFAERSLEERHADACQRRHVRLVEQPDGMADLIAHLPAVEAHGIYNRLTRISKKIGRAEARQAADQAANQPDDKSAVTKPRVRTRDQIRADVLAILAAKGSVDQPSTDSVSDKTRAYEVDGIYTGPNRITPQVQVIVPVETLGTQPTQALTSIGPLGYGPPDYRSPDTRPPPEEIAPTFGAPPLLTGYGPIDDRSATRLAAQADHWEVAYVESSNGVILSVDRYRPSEAMRRYLEVRDQHCRFPGCRVAASRCEMDHTIDAALGGPTITTNLEALCVGHHTIKHNSDWKVEQFHNGILRWTSPTGRTRVERPPSSVAFRPAPSDEEHPF